MIHVQDLLCKEPWNKKESPYAFILLLMINYNLNCIHYCIGQYGLEYLEKVMEYL